MKNCSIWTLLMFCLVTQTRGDELYLLAGNKFDGTVVKWSEKQLSFVLKGTTINEVFNIPVESISKVVLNDSTIHVPGEESWILNRELSQEELANAGLIKTNNSVRDASIKQSSKETTFERSKGRKGNDIIFEGSIQKMSGYTNYHITFVEGYYSWQSVLAFPVDGYKANIKASLFKHPFKTPDKFIGFELLYAKNITNPETTMVDSDYATYEAGSYSEKWVWSATQSTAEININELYAGFQIGKTLPYDITGAILLGYRYLKYSYDIYGIKGWQQPEYDGEIFTFDTLQNANVLDYRVSYHLPFLGLNLKFGMTENSWLNGRLIRYLKSGANDEDDHILRYFKATTDSKGSGWGAVVNGKINLIKLASDRIIFAGAGYEVIKITTTGLQTQTFYGDDPGTTDYDETGLTYTDIDNEIKLNQQTITVFLGLNY